MMLQQTWMFICCNLIDPESLNGSFQLIDHMESSLMSMSEQVLMHSTYNGHVRV